jgi:hypothetical protein
MVIDQFTKWLECYPLPDQTAESVARVFTDQFVSRLGCPLQIHTDQGANFESELFKAVCKILCVNKTRTTPYRPCSNGQVERMNRTLLQMIRCYLDGHLDTWDEFLPQLSGAIRASVSSSTGFTPNMLMLGREVDLPASLVYPSLSRQAVMNREDLEEPAYAMDLLMRLESAHHLARDRLRSAQRLQKKTYDLKAKHEEYHVGDLVYILHTDIKPGQSRKLLPVWRGPAIVTEVISSTLFRLRDQRRTFVLHHDRLRRCYERDVPPWFKRTRDRISHGTCINDEPPSKTRPRRQNAEDTVLKDLRFLFDVPQPLSTQGPLITRTGRRTGAPHHLKDFIC